MNLLPLPALTDEQIRCRLDARTHLLSIASGEDFERLALIFAQTEYLGNLLHAARECLESTAPDFGPTVDPAPPDGTTLLLWEHGLALPDEIDAGRVTALVRWYIDQLRHQRQETTEGRLARDSVSLYSELLRDDPRRTLGGIFR
jgi:hypothetical protein